ncbi:heat shock protein Hsp20 [Alkalithermobacter thermoalcaliphilus JW-YL-7 = DSM 7308]|uniref:Heat shock protein Hsp20 n=1 Tax=Alkalithermobacter thermoalcaliphilus JW-YL-7 = DSM 7308 TaxID=1121328 RepID=A0A150FSU4_CLOPD|nr:heat shock protein Hsp20 [[Clostridium] paradoxum JW-YL-7 = DSM 7308]SHL33985.1 heat shock protein Hsp20 [[Clostridium] paradoxum JW-YL-7 = DSM 7308]
MFDMIPFPRNSSALRRREDYINQIFNNFFNDDFFPSINTFEESFKVDLKETESEYLIEADLPGIHKEAIDIEYENNYLTITAKREDSIENTSDNYIRRERSYGEFKRRFFIDNVDEEKISASFTNGVLKIILPKLEKHKVSKKKITIK